MKVILSLLALAVLVSSERGGIRSRNTMSKGRGNNNRGNNKGSGNRGNNQMQSSDSDSDDGNEVAMANAAGGGTRTLTLTVINESFNQPFSGFFVMVHNSDATPLYRRGQDASSALARLAEDGNPRPLVDLYANAPGVNSAVVFNQGAPYFGGEALQIEVEVSDEYNLVTIATMAINTNDCFTSINGAALSPGQVLDLPGLDSGTEENNELCNSIPGPGCADISTENVESGNGEGFVHVHRGFFGIGDLLPADRYDWRNPMMRVVVS